MTNEQLKSLLTRYRIIQNLLRRATEAAVIISFFIIIVKSVAIGFILFLVCPLTLGTFWYNRGCGQNLGLCR